MTLPNGIDGIAEVIGQLFGVTGPTTQIPGQPTWGAPSISTMNTLTQTAVMDLLRTNVIRTSPGIGAASNAFYTDLTPGIPYTLAVIEQLVSAVTGLPLGTWSTVNAAVTELGTYFTTLQDEANAANAATQTFLNAIKTANTADAGNVPQWLTDVGAAYNTWASVESGIATSELATLQDILDTAFGIDPVTGLFSAANIAGVTSGQTLVDTFDAMWNQWITALGGDLTAIGLSGVAQLLSGLAINSTSPMAPIVGSVQTSAQILAIVAAQPVQQNLEATVVSSGDHKLAVALSTPVTPTASLGTIVTAGQAKTFGFLQWLGEYTSTLTDFVVNFYRMDGSGNLVYLFSTSDIGPGIPASMAWIVDIITALPCEATDLIGIELQVVTSGSVTPWGFNAPPAGNYPTSTTPVKMAGFSQNWSGATASTIAAASIGWVPRAPYVGIGVGSPPPTPFFPVQTQFPASGTHTPADWALLCDLVGVGGGGGGEGETGAGNGDGGTAASWGDATLMIGVTNTMHTGMDIPIGGVITITVGAGGAGGAFFTPGDDGTSTTFSWTDMSSTARTLTCTHGLGGQPSTNVTSWGLSPGNLMFDGFPYTGGAVNAIGGAGNSPGGGGPGGAAFQFGFIGAQGYAWTVDRQS